MILIVIVSILKILILLARCRWASPEIASHVRDAPASTCCMRVRARARRRMPHAACAIVRKSDFIHHHPGGVVYGSFCLNSSTVAVSKITSRRWWCIEWWCIESLFPIVHSGRQDNGDDTFTLVWDEDPVYYITV